MSSSTGYDMAYAESVYPSHLIAVLVSRVSNSYLSGLVNVYSFVISYIGNFAH